MKHKQLGLDHDQPMVGILTFMFILLIVARCSS